MPFRYPAANIQNIQKSPAGLASGVIDICRSVNLVFD
jgi:hypothetical protein